MVYAEITAEQIAAWISILAFVAGAIGWLRSWVKRQLNAVVSEMVQEHLALRRADLETDKNQYALVRSLMNRGMVKAEKRSMVAVKEKSNMIEYELSPKIRSAYVPIIPTLKQLWEQNPGISEAEFGLLLTRTDIGGVLLDDWLLEHICKVHDLDDLSCWKFAYIAATEGAKGLWDSHKEPIL